jgi:hypothetical protein
MALFLLDAAVKTAEAASWIAPVVTSLTTAFCGYAVLKFEEKRKELKEKKDEKKRYDNIEPTLKHNSEIQDKINEELNKIQGYTECSRACLYNYHNGTKTHQGYSMNFISMVEEATDGIVAPIITNFQAVPAATFRTILNQVDSSPDGFALFIRGEGSEEENRIHDKFQNNVSYYFKTGVSVFEGVVHLSWINVNRYLTQSEVDHVQQLVDNISTLQRQLIKPTTK